MKRLFNIFHKLYTREFIYSHNSSYFYGIYYKRFCKIFTINMLENFGNYLCFTVVERRIVVFLLLCVFVTIVPTSMAWNSVVLSNASLFSVPYKHMQTNCFTARENFWTFGENFDQNLCFLDVLFSCQEQQKKIMVLLLSVSEK